MAIPKLSSYPMPGEDELPRSVVSWQPDPQRAALLVHDMQNYFLAPFPAGQSPIPELIANIDRLRERCRELDIPVFFSAQPGDQNQSDRKLLTDFWGPGLPADPALEGIVADLAPQPGDIVLTKWRYSAFQRTNLRDQLARLCRDQIIVCGVYAHIGCMITACEAFMQDIKPFLVADAVADFSRADHRMALDYAARRCARILSTRQLLGELTEPAAEPLALVR